MTDNADSISGVPAGIGQLTERSLHAGLKAYLAQPGDRFEVKLGRYVIDIVRDDLLIEIQTRHLYALRPKLLRLLEDHRVSLLHPLPAERWIVREDRDGRLTRRQSPKHATVHDIFTELVRIPDLAVHPNLTLEVLLIREEQVWRDDGQGSWRRGRWSLVDRRLLGVAGSAVFAAPADFLALLPPLPEPFTNADLARARGWNSHLAGKATYALRAMGVLDLCGKRGRANLFTIAL
ncbi:MAG: hypothetical protein KA586_00295 [Candidatus Promineofilum sp.]|nr:hypothetical protein [Promineifilum sp.]